MHGSVPTVVKHNAELLSDQLRIVDLGKRFVVSYAESVKRRSGQTVIFVHDESNLICRRWNTRFRHPVRGEHGIAVLQIFRIAQRLVPIRAVHGDVFIARFRNDIQIDAVRIGYIYDKSVAFIFEVVYKFFVELLFLLFQLFDFVGVDSRGVFGIFFQSFGVAARSALTANIGNLRNGGAD